MKSSVPYFLFALAILIGSSCQNSVKQDEYKVWEVYKGDPASTSYSALDQINSENVSELKVSWQYQFTDVPAGRRYGKYECNPIIVEDVMYCTSSRSWAYALKAATGELIWSFDPFDGERGGGMKRGVTYWEGNGNTRILFTAGNFLWSLDAKTGTPDEHFGREGKVDLNLDLGVNPDSIWVKPTSPGIIFEDLIILGSEVSESYGAAPGHIRAYDVLSGEMVWIFHTIPQPGEYGYETWPEGAYRRAGGANNWGGMSLDHKAGIVYAPLGSPTYDFYGADRHGDNLFGNSLVALDAATGERIWHFQTVHHDVWDYDLPAPPSLVDLDGVPGVSLVTKTGFVFLFNRLTGEPIFPVEEQSVPVSKIPGESLSTTQPFPVLPRPFVHQRMDSTMLMMLPDTLRSSVLDRLSELQSGGLYTPPTEHGTLMVPGTRGGAEWGGSAIDVKNGVLYINANESPEIMQLQSVSRESFSGRTTYQAGQRYYLSSCAICHGGKRQGQLPHFPSLNQIKDRMGRADAAEIITKGLGRMPAFDHLSDRAVDAILDFLYEVKDQEREVTSDDQELLSESFKNISAYSFFRDAAGYPAINPPWGTLSAIDLASGDYLWKVPLGNYPDRQMPGGPETGTENWGGPIVTAGGLVFIGATQDQYIRAFSAQTGEVLWTYKLPGNGYATPSTYEINGQQFVTIAVSGTEENSGGQIIAFSL